MANVSSSNGLEKRPKLRFPGFDEPWRSIAFGNLVHEYSDRTKEEDEDTLLSAAIEGMFLNTELFGHQRGASNKGYKKIKYGTMVLSTQNLHLGNANVNLRFDHGMVSPAYKTYVITGCSVDLIAQWIKSDAAKRFFYNATTVGASVCRRNVEWDTLYEQSLYLPCRDEQEKVAKFLGLLSNRINKQQRFVSALKKYKRGAIQKLFSETDMEQWNLVKLKDVVKVFDGTHQTPNYKTTGVRFISVENILDPLATQKYISEDDYRKEFKVHPEYGDVLMTRIGDIGRTYYVNFDSDMAYYVSLALFKCSPKIEGRFLAAYISTNTFQKELWERTLHIAFPKKINTGEIGECSIRLPSRERQIAIASYLDVIEKKIRLAEKKLDLIQIIKTGLMQQLFI